MNIHDFLNVGINQHFTVLGFAEGATYYVDADGDIRYHNGVGVTRIGFKNIIDNASKVKVIPMFTDDEISTMRKLHDIGYRFIGRDDDDSLWAYLTKPNAVHDEYHGVFERFETEEYDNMWQLPPKLIPCAPGYLIDTADHI